VGELRAVVRANPLADDGGNAGHVSELSDHTELAMKSAHSAIAACVEMTADCRTFFLWLQQHMRR
jgi:hypothetical protein